MPHLRLQHDPEQLYLFLFSFILFPPCLAEPIGAEKVDVVIIFSKNCVVAYQWITYLTEILSKIFSSNERPPTR